MHIALGRAVTSRVLGRSPRAKGLGPLYGCLAAALALGCSGSSAGDGGAVGSIGGNVGTTASGGKSAASAAVGGFGTTTRTNSSGGTSSTGATNISGGASSSGAESSTGGAKNVGGQTSAAGRAASGGAVQAGGSKSTGGTKQSGGNAATAGGANSAGGSNASNANSGGSKSTSGGAANAGRENTGGATAAGGVSSASGGTSAKGGDSATGGASATCPSTYSNPVIWEDLPDVEVIRVDDTYYYTASSFHYSPGAPVLRSYDLVNWEYIGHSVPVLDSDASYDLSGGKRSYVNGVWASSLRYRKSNKTYYWIGCMHGPGGGLMYTSGSPEGPWTKHKLQNCYYDVGLLIDDDDKMYVAYGNTTLNVAQLNPDDFTQIKTQVVLNSPSDIGALEGSRFYKIDGNYYIFSTQYANGEYVLRSTNGPFGTYTLQKFAVKLPYAGSGSGASPHQGGIVDTQNGDWYYMAFNDSYPAGRIPVLAPMTWSDGWPSVTLVNGSWGASYPFPNLPCGAGRVKSLIGTDTFEAATLGHQWEWNHNPDDTKWSAGGGLTLQTATVTTDLYAARNTLTHRIPGPTSTATIELDYSTMKDGDVAGLAALRDSSAWIGIKRANGADRVVMVDNLTLDSDWKTSSTGTEVANASASGGKIWLRIAANIRTDSGGGSARFYYSTDGSQFTQLGSAFTMKKEWQFFLGYRYAIFNYATQALGGSVKVTSFELVKP
jgi:beta-xylosidase